MGTPEFAVATLEAIVEAGHELAAVVTQPDKRRGRGKAMLMPPVKERALLYGVPIYQPEKIRGNQEFFDTLKEINPDVIVVVAFGQILPVSVLNLPKYGCINVHASILPKYRGAAPIQWVVINGEKESGVTTMLMDKGLDTGDMLLKEVVPIDGKETYGSYHDKLMPVGARLLVETLAGLEDGSIVPVKQEGDTCYASMIDKELAQISWDTPAYELERLIRGLNPVPAAFTRLDGKVLKIFMADAVDAIVSAVPGTIISVGRDYFDVACKDGTLRVLRLQLEGKKQMDAADFLRGCKLAEGTILG